MEQLPNIVRERLKAGAGGDHPDADLLTAFAEQALPEQERSHVLLHVSRCADCREVLALAVPPVKAADLLDTARPAPWFQWRVLRWGAAAACVVIVGSAVLLKREAMAPKTASVAVDQEKQSGEQLAYERVDRTGKASPTLNLQAPAATPTDNEKDAARLEDRALKAAVSPKRVPATPSPAQETAVLGGYKKQASAGQMASSADHGVAASIKSHGVQALNTTSTPPVISGTIPAVAETKRPTLESRADKDLAILDKATETVEVQAAASAPGPASSASPVLDHELSPDKREAVGKAKPAIGAMGTMAAAESGGAARNSSNSERAEETVAQKMDRSKLRRSLVSRWTISSDGQLQHSIDAGQSWQPVKVADKASFRALSANGPDIWVGGAAGLLYHSRDSGFSWEQVKPSFAGVNLTADISAIEFTDILHGKITTADGQAWTTEDAGQSWRKQ